MPNTVALHAEHLARAIADDHAKIVATLRHLRAGRGDRRVLVDALRIDLARHAIAEEIVLHPAVRDLPVVGPGLDDDAAGDHRVIKDTLVELDRTDPWTPAFEAALTRLTVTLDHHLAAEEGETLPLLRRALGDDRMVQLGRQFCDLKRHLPTRAHPFAPAAPPANLLTHVAAPIDRLRDRVSGRHRRLRADHSGLLDGDAQAVLDAFGAVRPVPIELTTVSVARRQPTLADAVDVVRKQRGQAMEPEPVALVVDRPVRGAGGVITIRVYAPEVEDRGQLPVLVHAPSGGWVLADRRSDDAVCRALANRARCVVVSVGYRRAPESPFPAAHDDVLAVTRWVLDHAVAVGGDGDRVAVSGEGAGATLAAAAAWQLHRAGDDRLRFQLLICPMTSGLALTGTSRLDAADAVPLNRPMISWFLKHAVADPAHARDPRIELVSIPIDELAGLPPAMVITAERDPLRSEGERYAQRLADAGVPVVATRFEGMPHGFFSTGAVVETARQAVSEAATQLRRHLGPAARPAGTSARRGR